MKKMLVCIMASFWLSVSCLAQAQAPDEEAEPESPPAVSSVAQDQDCQDEEADSDTQPAVTPAAQDQAGQAGAADSATPPAVTPAVQDQAGQDEKADSDTPPAVTPAVQDQDGQDEAADSDAPPADTPEAQDGEAESDFRQVSWGMTPEEVEQAETRAKKLYAVSDEQSPFSSLVYDANIAGKAFSLEYIFLNGKLNRAILVGQGNYVNKNNHVSEYETLKKMLTERYGAPTEDETTWSQTFYKDDPEYLGTAYSRGDVKSRVFWKTGKNAVQLEIYGEQFKIEVVLTYFPSEHLDEYMKASEEASLNDL